MSATATGTAPDPAGGNLTCAHCHGPTSAGTMIFGVLRCACCAPGAPKAERAARHPDAVVCSRQCSRAQTWRTIATHHQCAVCGAKIDTSHLFAPNGSRLAGRPPTYCGDRCRGWMRGELRAAEKELARDRYAKDLGGLEEQQRRTHALLARWGGDRDEEATASAPSEVAVQRLRERRDELGRRLAQARADAWAETEAERQVRQKASWTERVSRQAEMERGWREQLLNDGGPT